MIQPQQLHLPTQRDPLARLGLFALVALACYTALSVPSVPEIAQAQAPVRATATIMIFPTSTAVPPTSVPIAAPAVEVAPTLAPPSSEPQPTAEPVIVEVPVMVEVTAVPTDSPPPPPATEPPTAEPTRAPLSGVTLDSGVVIGPTATPSNQQFIDSFGPTPATCSMVGSLNSNTPVCK